MDTVPEFYAEAPQATVSEGIAQGPYDEARADKRRWLYQCATHASQEIISLGNHIVKEIEFSIW